MTQVVTPANSQTISYETLLYNSTNVAGGLDTRTGMFTAGRAGTFTVTWSLRTDDDEWDELMRVYLRKNQYIIQESLHQSGSAVSSEDQGGRTLLLHLAEGETVDLYCVDCSAWVYSITFCVSLSTYDI